MNPCPVCHDPSPCYRAHEGCLLCHGTRTVPAVVPCTVALLGVARFDARIGGVTYLGLAIHGNGGLLARPWTEAQYVAYWNHRQAHDTHPALLWVVQTATESEGFHAFACDVEILRVWQ